MRLLLWKRVQWRIKSLLHSSITELITCFCCCGFHRRYTFVSLSRTSSSRYGHFTRSVHGQHNTGGQNFTRWLNASVTTVADSCDLLLWLYLWLLVRPNARDMTRQPASQASIGGHLYKQPGSGKNVHGSPSIWSTTRSFIAQGL